jgi:hypothetical protein
MNLVFDKRGKIAGTDSRRRFEAMFVLKTATLESHLR